MSAIFQIKGMLEFDGSVVRFLPEGGQPAGLALDEEKGLQKLLAMVMNQYATGLHNVASQIYSQARDA